MRSVLFALVIVGALAGCAASPQTPRSTHFSATTGPAPDFQSDSTANLSASQAADQLVNQLTSTMPDAYNRAFAGTAVVKTGLEISLAGPDASVVSSAIPATVDGVPVHVRIVAHSYADLQPVMNRIGGDQQLWSAQGVVLSGWGPDYASNKVLVSLEKYSSAAATAIESKYGKDLVTVSTVSRVNSAS